MTAESTPQQWAFAITHVLNAALGIDHFPIKVAEVAQQYSLQRFPDDPIVSVAGDDLPNFEGALFPAPRGKKGWGIIYNGSIRSKGRINFTLAHEFGHYLLHRIAYPKGFNCGEEDVAWDSELGQVEHQANLFAANFLMPLDDFRRQINPKAAVTLEMIDACRERYQVSLIAATLRWLEYTEKRAVLVVSRDGFILWARSSTKALRTGAFFRTSAGPIELPWTSLPVRGAQFSDGRTVVDHPPGVWFQEPVREIALVAEQYDFAMSLLLLDDEKAWFPSKDEEEFDTYDKMAPKVRRREW